MLGLLCQPAGEWEEKRPNKKISTKITMKQKQIMKDFFPFDEFAFVFLFYERTQFQLKSCPTPKPRQKKTYCVTKKCNSCGKYCISNGNVAGQVEKNTRSYLTVTCGYRNSTECIEPPLIRIMLTYCEMLPIISWSNSQSAQSQIESLRRHQHITHILNESGKYAVWHIDNE